MVETKRILFVEDNVNDIELTLTALEENALANEVVVVHDGEEALDYLYQRNKYAERPAGLPVVVLLDVKLPKVDGLEVLKQMRADPKLRVVPVVMLSSSREEKDLLLSYALGTSAYVVKPVDFFEFAETIKQLGLFWGIINEPPPGIERIPRNVNLLKQSSAYRKTSRLPGSAGSEEREKT
jgi:CheY-like chemotaxis protein